MHCFPRRDVMSQFDVSVFLRVSQPDPKFLSPASSTVQREYGGEEGEKWQSLPPEPGNKHVCVRVCGDGEPLVTPFT